MIEPILVIIRVGTYLWIMGEAMITAYLYWEALKMMKKKSKMIEAVINLLIATSITFLMMSLVTFIRLINQNIYLNYVQILFIPVILMGICLRQFRYWTIHTPLKVNLDKEIIKLKEIKKGGKNGNR